jgi:Hemerythrin HHE cation binding domain
MGTGNERDVLDEVLKDHEEITELLTLVQAATSPGDKSAAFANLAGKLKAHEHAEQEVVHPLLNGVASGEVDERLAEEARGEQALSELEAMGCDDPRFDEAFQALKADIVKHAKAEEHEEHPEIKRAVDPGELQRLAAAFQEAEAAATVR